MTIQQLCTELNKVFTCGTFEVMDSDMCDQAGFNDAEPEDIGIYYDYISDELSEPEKDKLVTWLYDDPNGGHEVIKSWMSSNGYELINEIDGSGDGMYYGGTLYRKV
jgi:hypothetical protein